MYVWIFPANREQNSNVRLKVLRHSAFQQQIWFSSQKYGSQICGTRRKVYKNMYNRLILLQRATCARRRTRAL